MARDGRCSLAVQPEFFACIGADGNEALAGTRIGDAHHLGSGTRHHVGVVAGNVAHQHHLGQSAALGLGGVTDGLEVAVVQVFKARQDGAAALLLGEHEVLDLDDAGHRVLGVAKKLEADRARVRRHFVHDPAGAGDQAVAAFFLDAGQAAQKLVGDVLAQAFLAKGSAGNVEPLGAHRRLAVGFKVVELKTRRLDVVNLAQVVVQANHLQPLRVRRDHAPGGQIVQRRAPEHSFFAAGVHGDVAANAGGFG